MKAKITATCSCGWKITTEGAYKLANKLADTLRNQHATDAQCQKTWDKLCVACAKQGFECVCDDAYELKLAKRQECA